MKAIVFNDIHLFSEYNDDPSLKDKLCTMHKNPWPLTKDHTVTVLNGDIVDLSACRKKDVAEAVLFQQCLMTKWGEYYVRGNHDLMPKWYKELVVGKTLFMHGHLTGSSKRVAKWAKYEQKKAGAGFLKQLWVNIADDMDWLKGIRPLPDDTIRAAALRAKELGCTEVILGHYHPLKELKHLHLGVTVRCLPKGMNHINIEGLG